MRILIAPDKFKGALNAREVAESIAAGLREVLPDAEMDVAPMAAREPRKRFATRSAVHG